MKVFMFCVAAQGHLNPMLALAKGLVEKGEKVKFFTSPRIKKQVERTGAEFRPVITAADDELLNVNPEHAKNGMFIWRMVVESAEEALDQLYEEIKSDPPDYIINDIMSLDAKVYSRDINIPRIVNVPVFAFPRTFIGATPYGTQYNLLFNALVNLKEALRGLPAALKLRKKHKMTFDEIARMHNAYAGLNIVTTSKEFQFFGNRFDESKFIFTGPMIDKSREDEDFPYRELLHGKVIYISLGTIYSRRPEFFQKCFEAFRNTEYKVVLSVGSFVNIEDLVGIPDNFIVRNFVPQLQVLPYADVFVTHGGMNSINEGLFFGVPMIVVPQALDQYLTCKRVKELGAGIYIKKPDEVSLKKGVENVMSDPVYRQNAMKLGRGLKSAGGVDRAMEAIFGYIKTM